MVGFSKTEPAKKCVDVVPKLENHPEIAKTLEKPTNLREAFQSIIISDAFEIEMDGQAKLQELIELVKVDDSVMAGSLAISSAVSLWRKNNELNIDRLLEVVDLDDLYAQADQVEKQVSFNNDIAVTFFFVQAAFDLSDYKQASQLSADKIIGFGNFIVAGVRPSNSMEYYYYLKLSAQLAVGSYGGAVRVSLVHNRPISYVSFLLN